MKSFLNYAKNRFLYNLLRLAIVFGLGLIASQFLFIPKVYAATYTVDQFDAQLYDNYGPTLYSVTTEFVTNRYQGVIPSMTGNSSGAAWGISSPITLLANHTYTMSVSINGTYGGNIVLSSYNRIGVGTSLYNAAVSYQDNSSVTENYSKSLDDGMTLQFAFTPTINASYIVFPFATSSTGGPWTFYIENIVIDDLGASGVTETEINNSLSNQTTEINTSIENSTNTITDSITQTEENINNNINEKFETCKPTGKNLYDYVNNTFTGPYYNSSGENLTSSFKSTINFIKIEPNTKYTFSGLPVSSSNWFYYAYFDSDYNFISRPGAALTSSTRTITTPTNARYVKFVAIPSVVSSSLSNLQFEKGSEASSYESYKEVCTNRIDETNDKLDEAENTRKGILASIIELPSKIINGILDTLKSLFIPEDGFFSDWFDDFMSYVEVKLGFLATPFTLFIDFIESYLNLSSSTDVIINIPDISVPNFEEHVIVHATSFNWTQTLKSKDSLNTLWQLYLDFVDVFLILNFIGLCESVYNRIFGGNTSNYEYYTVEDSYTYDNQTGEVLSSRRNERTTSRKKVDS